MQAFHEKFNRFGEWVIRLVILNVLWLGFSVVGLGILGVFPSTSALFSVLRKWFIGQEQVKITKEFFQYYRQDFWKSNGLGYSLLFIAVILWIDFQFVSSIAHYSTFTLGYIVLLLLAFSLLSCCVVFPIYAHYQLSFLHYIKYTLLFPITNTLSMIVLTVLLFIAQAIFHQFPGFIMFIGVSFPAFIVMKITYPIFQGKQPFISKWIKQMKKAKAERAYF